MENQTDDYLKGVVESILFVSDKPVTLEQIKEASETATVADVRRCINELQEEYENSRRGMLIMEIAGGYQTFSNPLYATFVRNFFKTRVKEKLSRPALETLAIIAYKQPVSRADVELIRGVNSDGVVMHLLDKGLIKISGRKDVPGRPYLYSTTKVFLEYFGLKTLKDLPKLEDFSILKAPDVDQATESVDVSSSPQDPQQTLPENQEPAGGEQARVQEESRIPSDIEDEQLDLGESVEESAGDSQPSEDHESQEDPIQLKQAMQEVTHQETV